MIKEILKAITAETTLKQLHYPKKYDQKTSLSSVYNIPADKRCNYQNLLHYYTSTHVG